MKIFKTCQLFLQHCRVERNLSKNSIQAYQSDLNSFQRFYKNSKPNIQLTECDLSLLQDYLYYLKKDRGLKEITIKRLFSCLRTMFCWLEKINLIPVSPFYRFEYKPKLPKRLPRNLSTTEVHKLFEVSAQKVGFKSAMSYNFTSPSLQISGKFLNQFTTLLSLELLFTTGIRVGELSEICLNHVDFHKGIIRIHGKGDHERQVFITDPELKKLLAGYLSILPQTSNCQQRPLLLNSRKKPASTQFLRKLIRKAGESASLNRRVTPHMLRHSCATQLLEFGMEIHLVQKLLGHQNITTTQLYTQVSNNSLKKALSLADIRGRTLKM